MSNHLVPGARGIHAKPRKKNVKNREQSQESQVNNLKWTFEKEVNLINEIRQIRMLWFTSDKDYKKTGVKSVHWKKICEKLQIDGKFTFYSSLSLH